MFLVVVDIPVSRSIFAKTAFGHKNLALLRKAHETFTDAVPKSKSVMLHSWRLDVCLPSGQVT
jgi:hypothetical protein